MNNNVVILSFSARANGNCTKIADFITEYHKRTNVRLFVIDSENFSPCGACDYECLTAGKLCPKMNTQHRQVMDAICESSITYFIVPNYCGYPCSNYFAFNERSVGYFNMDNELLNRYMSAPKRFIIVSNTDSDNFANAMRQQTTDEPDILYLKSGKYQRQSTAGDILESEAARADLKAFLDIRHPR